MKKLLLIIIKKIKILLSPLISKLRLVKFLNLKSKLYSSNLVVINREIISIDIITIAFNNVKFIEYQIKLLKKNLEDEFTHIVADNSSSLKIQEEIHELCIKYGVLYVSIPPNTYTPNKSHSAAMHWVFKNVVKLRKPTYFGYLDHDIFPMTKTSIINKFNKNGIYGRITPAYNLNKESISVSTLQPYWSMWAGFNFFSFSLFKNLNIYILDFGAKYPKKGLYLDTGGGLWYKILYKIPFPDEMAKYSCIKFRDTPMGNAQTDYYEKLDEWLHIGNLSNWHYTEDFEQKISFFEEMLENALKAKN
jgi:glycosyltransferase involved in cell wall biosynthesis